MSSKNTQGGQNNRGYVEIQLFAEVRGRLGWTQEQMGGFLSITARQYGRIERGERKAPKKTWLLFCMFALMMIPGSSVSLPEDDGELGDFLD